MQCLTPSESAEWLRSHRINGLSDGGGPCVFGDYEVFAASPRDARIQQFLARDLVTWLGEFESALFWLTDWPFYEPYELTLISSLRKGHGEHRPLIEAPGHVFAESERDELIGWVSLMMCFGWDGYLFTSPFQGSLFQTSHEDFVWLWSSVAGRFAEAQRIIRGYDLTIHRETQVPI
jgi:hypothetical protein